MKNFPPLQLAFWILVAIVVLAILAIKYLPWWALILLLVVGALALQWGVKAAVKQAMLLPFRLKGQTLKAAQVQVHRVQGIPMPIIIEEGDAAEYADRRARYHQLKWYSVDVSILPAPPDQAQQNPFAAWEPSELLLVKPGSTVKDLKDLEGLKITSAAIHDYAIYRSTSFYMDTEGKHLGSQRLKFIVGVPPGTETLQFRYYLELFGRVEFPQGMGADRQLKPA
jgi:hypothetical protein